MTEIMKILRCDSQGISETLSSPGNLNCRTKEWQRKEVRKNR